MTIVIQPRTSVSIVPASVAVENAAQKILFVGQKFEVGSTAVSGALVQNIGSDGAEDALFGQGSMLAGMIKAARRLNKATWIDAIPLSDAAGGAQATGSITITGTATAAGTLTVSVGSELRHTYSIAVASGDTATVIASNIKTAINDDLDLPVEAAESLGVVTLTAAHKGTLGNDIGVAVSGTVAGITHSAAAMSGGATDPTLTGVFNVVGNNRYQTIVWPYASATTEVRSFLDARWNVDNRVLDGVAITARHDSIANHLSVLGALNSQSLVYFADKTTSETSYKGAAQLEMSPVKSAQFAAIRGLRLTDGASISRFVITTNGPLDSFGGPALASKPYFNTSMPDLPLIAVGRGWTDTEIEQLFDAGGSVIGVNSAGNAAIAGEIVTTYKTDSAANPDISFKFLNYVDTASNSREYFFNNLKARFAQSRLTTGDVLKGRDMANDLVIKAFCEKLYQDLSGVDFVLLQSGEDALKFFKDNLSVALDLANGKATIQMTAPLVTQLREIVATLKIAFSTEG